MKVFDANGNELTLPIKKTWEQPIKDMAQRSPDSPPAWAYSNGQISWHEWLMSQGRTEEAMAELPEGMRSDK